MGKVIQYHKVQLIVKRHKDEDSETVAKYTNRITHSANFEFFGEFCCQNPPFCPLICPNLSKVNATNIFRNSLTP